MRNLKTLGLTVLAVAALLALAGASNASATVLCKNNLNTTACSETYAAGTEITGNLAAKYAIEPKIGVGLECYSSLLSAKTQNTGGSNETINVSKTGFILSNCNGCGFSLNPGSLEVHHIAGTDDGTVTSSGTQITTRCNTLFGLADCTYRTENTDIGTLEGGSPARLVIEAPLEIVSTTFPCNWELEELKEEAIWTAEYVINSPKPLYVAAG